MDVIIIGLHMLGEIMDEFSDIENEELISWLEEQGALHWEGVSEDGEPMFRFDLEVLERVMPALYETIMEEIDADLMELYKKDLVEIEYDENLNAMFRMSEKGIKFFEDLGEDTPFPN